MVKSLTDYINHTYKEIELGEIQARVNEDKYQGGYKTAASSINNALTSLINDVLDVIGYFNHFAEGEFEFSVKTYPGKKYILNETINKMQQNLVSVSDSIGLLVQSAIDGNLDSKVDPSSFNGGWKKIITGLNDLLKTIAEPIEDANDTLAYLAKGNFNISITKNYKGVFGKMKGSFETMIGSIGSYIDEITHSLSAISNGDMRTRIGREYIGQFSEIKDAINKIASTLQQTIEEINTASENVLAGAKHISDSSMSLAEGASEQAATIQELTSSVLIINDKVQHSAVSSNEAMGLSQKSVTSAQRGNEEMNTMLSAMDDIRQASHDISNIIKVIDNIAFQTNLLALNAAVEAARAGEHGKGFGVVADEVGVLAIRSQKAAKETSELIEASIEKVNSGTQIAHATAQTLSKVIEDSNSISTIIKEISDSANEQAEALSQITDGLTQISTVVQNNSSTSEEAAAAAQELNSQSEVLTDMMKFFRV